MAIDEAASSESGSVAVAAPRPRGSGISIRWQRRLFLLPAVVVVLAVVIFPTIFGIYISFTEWLLNAERGRHFIGL
ncbi:MAG TPA: hypothetical protein VFL82_12400, partial [Thermomicrobiales bacterium]|nr:hypothetical protein [Thermomicrobiales bacterium]